MGRIKTLKPKVGSPPSRVAPATTTERRMTGRALQSRRLKLWKEDPHCAHCSRVVAYPYGFELDHIVSLEAGGSDTDLNNLQLLCVDDGDIEGCHSKKTRAERKYIHGV